MTFVLFFTCKMNVLNDHIIRRINKRSLLSAVYIHLKLNTVLPNLVEQVIHIQRSQDQILRRLKGHP